MPMHILTVASARGGTGATTTAVHLAAELARAGYQVALQDLDPEAGATRALERSPADDPWKASAEVIELDGGRAAFQLRSGGRALAGARGPDIRALLDTRAAYDFLIVDTPGAAFPITTAALESAHTLVVPVRADDSALADLKTMSQLRYLLVGTSPNLFAVLVRVAADPATLRARIAAIYPTALLETDVPEDARAAASQPFRLQTSHEAAVDAYGRLARELGRRLQNRA